MYCRKEVLVTIKPGMILNYQFLTVLHCDTYCDSAGFIFWSIGLVHTVYLYRNKSLASHWLMTVLDYGQIIYVHTTSRILKSLDVVCHCAIHFITGDGFLSYHFHLYWLSMSTRRAQHWFLITGYITL